MMEHGEARQRRGTSLVELAIYVILASLMLFALYQMLRSGIRLFRSTEGHNESLVAITLVDRILWEDFANLHVPGPMRETLNAPPTLDLGPFGPEPTEPFGAESRVPCPFLRRVRLQVGETLRFQRLRSEGVDQVQRIVTVSYRLLPARGAAPGDRLFVLQREELGSAPRNFANCRLAEVNLEFMTLFSSEKEEARRHPLFFVRWTLVGSSMGRHANKEGEGYRDDFVNAIAVRRPGDLLRQGASGLYWNAVDARVDDMRYLEER